MGLMASESIMEKGDLRNSSKNPKGGFITLPFIIANEALEKVPSYALVPTMMLYLKTNYHMTMAAGYTLINCGRPLAILLLFWVLLSPILTWVVFFINITC
ncbi:hypothetical protein F3Y22_tig00111769pilonHSYRG00422 [Hibiscus syriacus]|uniref:Uncharacterized protein n=1 Tax=Hibiscus syriacus TaxID=106335 RepID=A0A6A2YHF4_HIBSY|nr:hypothetical protein F3Y22_tig00111769pilonHSYRG00422 [Hibiscus syriacus]